MNSHPHPYRPAAALASFLVFLGAATSSAETVRLAGSFNNWAASDDSFTMKPAGQRLELVRYWECGPYEFKFVFDGSWSRHLGDAGNGRLDQPGGNIPLAIQGSGDYAIWLQPNEKKWGIEKRAGRLHARFRVNDASTRTCQLDASLTRAGPDRAIQSYTWRIESEDGRSVHPSPTGSEPLFSPPGPGRYRIKLSITDGEQTDTTEQQCELSQGYECFDGRTNDDGELLPNPMYPGDGGLWTARLPAGQVGKRKLAVRGAAQRGKGQPVVEVEGELKNGRQTIVVFDQRTGSISLAFDGWQSFAFVPAKEHRLPTDLVVERVDLVGSFNNWSVGASPMLPAVGIPRFHRRLPFPEGTHRYKFVVNGCIWLDDNSDDVQHESDGKGGRNSVFRIGPDAKKLGPARPNELTCAGVGHDPTRAEFLTPVGRNLAQVVLRVLHDDVDSVNLRPHAAMAAVPMQRTSERDGFDYWTANLSTESKSIGYSFELADGALKWKLDAAGCGNQPADKPFETELRMKFETPDWAKRAVWYQIFPERFANGDPTNDPPRTVPWTHEWYKPYKPKRGKKASKGEFTESGKFFEYIFDRRYGGDIQGVRHRLGYLRDLGITAIYFNPIFEAESLHKYDASDYRHIDDYFGVKGSLKKIRGETTDPATWQWSETDRIFLDFVKEAHCMGFKVVLDGVFNHVGRDFWAFRDVLRNREKSPYAGWFDITSWKPFHYAAWDKPDGSLPRLKHDEAKGLAEPVRQHLFAVTRRWMDPNGDGDPSDGIDGWRLDVAGDINANFWRDWRKLVKSVNPDAYIVAELWQESKPWLTGDTFDAVMNYPFAVRCQRFFINKKKRIKPSEFDKELAEILNWYPPQVNYVLQNLFDSHDTDRVASMFMNPDLEYDQANRQQDNGPKYNPAKPTKDCYRRLKLLTTFQMTFLGAPMIYYGNEVGMYGADDPSCRKPMLWKDLMPYDDPDERIEPDVFAHFKWAVALRNSFPALQLGTFRTLLARDSTGVFAFARSLDDQTLVVVINNSPQNRRLDVPVPWPNATAVAQLDDPAVFEVVDPPADQPTARPSIRFVKEKTSKVRVEGGHLKGLMLDGYSGTVFAKAAD